MACDVHCRSHRPIPTGTRVRGTYLGVAFEGTVTHQAGGLHWCLPRYTVALNTPIVVLGEARDRVLIDMNDTLPSRGRQPRYALEVAP
jgi:hypothetical protein